MIPHLLRADPDRKWLAVVDGKGTRVDRRWIGSARPRRPRTAEIDGVVGRVHTARWIDGDQGLAIATDDNVFVVPLGSADRVSAQPVFSREFFPSVERIVDIRRAPGGLLVRALSPETRLTDSCRVREPDVFWVSIADHTVQEVRSLHPDRGDHRAGNATVTPDGRIILAVGHLGPGLSSRCGRRRPIVRSWSHWTFDVGSEFGPRLATRQTPPGNTDVGNWAAHSDRTSFATLQGDIVIQTPGSPANLLPRTETGWNSVRVLWWNASGDRLFAATESLLQVWNPAGKELWRWRPRTGTVIHGGHFDGPDVLVAAGREIVRVRAGRARRVVRVRKGRKWNRLALHDPPRHHETFVDDLIPVPNGGIAYAVVDTYDFSHGGSFVGCDDHTRAGRSRVTKAQAEQFSGDQGLRQDVREYWRRQVSCFDTPAR